MKSLITAIILAFTLTGCGGMMVSDIDPNVKVQDVNLTLIGDGILAEIQFNHNGTVLIYKDNKSPTITLFRQGYKAYWKGKYACGTNVSSTSRSNAQGAGVNWGGGLVTAKANNRTKTSTSTSTKMCELALGINGDTQEFTVMDWNLNYVNVILKEVK